VDYSKEETIMFKEFKEFAMRGNVLDMAIGIIIGAAFGKIISSFVTDILMPPIGLLMGGADFSNYFFTIKGAVQPTLAAAKAAGAVTINYGFFINTVLDFLIVAVAIFMLIRQVNRLKKKEEPAPAVPATKECPQCLSAIPLKAKRCAHCTTQLTSA
jgi:large conductance mechanosensitive channel